MNIQHTLHKVIHQSINNANESIAPKRKCQGKMNIQHTLHKVIHQSS